MKKGKEKKDKSHIDNKLTFLLLLVRSTRFFLLFGGRGGGGVCVVEDIREGGEGIYSQKDLRLFIYCYFFPIPPKRKKMMVHEKEKKKGPVLDAFFFFLRDSLS